MLFASLLKSSLFALEVYDKKISKKKSSRCIIRWLNAFMHWLTKYINKTCHTHSDALYTMATLFNNHPYISSSKFSANWCATVLHLQLMCYPHMCAQTNGFQQPVHSAPSVFPAKKTTSTKSQLHSKQSANEPSPENISRLLVAVLNATHIALWC